MSDTEINRLQELHEKTQKAFNANQNAREESENDWTFYQNQWDDLEDYVSLEYRGSFDLIKRAIRDVLSELRNVEFNIEFTPKLDTTAKDAEFVQGLYRAMSKDNDSIDAEETAFTECAICGVGGYELITEYEHSAGQYNHQVIKKRPIPSFNSTVFYDPNSYKMDRSDAKYVTILTASTEDYIKELCEENGIDPDDCVIGSAFHPQTDYSFSYQFRGNSGDKTYLGTTYEKELVDTKEHKLTDLFGNEIVLSDEEFKERQEELIDTGYQYVADRSVKRWQVRKVIWTSGTIIYDEIVNFDSIPVVPVFGEIYNIQGGQVWQGIVRDAKDPQRLRNTALSFMASILSTTHRGKPIFTPQQVEGHEWMYQNNGLDNSYPYFLANDTNADGDPLPTGSQPAQMPNEDIPSSVLQVIVETEKAIGAVANPALPDDVAVSNTSGVAIQAMNQMVDKQTEIYMSHLKHAMRYDATVWLGAAKSVYDTNRQVTVRAPDGTISQAVVQEAFIDSQGNISYLNDLRDKEFEVTSEIGVAYKSQRDKNIATLERMLPVADDETRQILSLQILAQMDGSDAKLIRDHVNRKLLLLGVKEPSTPEEQQIVMAASQVQQQPDPNMLLAQAEMMNAQTKQAEAQLKVMESGADMQIQKDKVAVDVFNAQTRRFDSEVKAQEAQANIALKSREQVLKASDRLRARIG